MDFNEQVLRQLEIVGKHLEQTSENHTKNFDKVYKSLENIQDELKNIHLDNAKSNEKANRLEEKQEKIQNDLDLQGLKIEGIKDDDSVIRERVARLEDWKTHHAESYTKLQGKVDVLDTKQTSDDVKVNMMWDWIQKYGLQIVVLAIVAWQSLKDKVV